MMLPEKALEVMHSWAVRESLSTEQVVAWSHAAQFVSTEK
jgi:hypothetical protein